MNNKFEILNMEMITAMKNKDIVRRDAVRSVIANVRKAAIDKRCSVTDTLVDEVLLKEVKMLKEQIDTCPKERTKTLDDYRSRLAIINEFAPKLKTDPQEIEDLINYIIDNYDVDISSMGSAMKTIMPHLKGECDMKIASQVLKDMSF